MGFSAATGRDGGAGFGAAGVPCETGCCGGPAGCCGGDDLAGAAGTQDCTGLCAPIGAFAGVGCGPFGGGVFTAIGRGYPGTCEDIVAQGLGRTAGVSGEDCGAVDPGSSVGAGVTTAVTPRCGKCRVSH